MRLLYILLALIIVLGIGSTIFFHKDSTYSSVEHDLRVQLEKLKTEKRDLSKLVSELGLGSHLNANKSCDPPQHPKREVEPTEVRLSEHAEPAPPKELGETTVSCHVGTTWTAICDFRSVCYREGKLIVVIDGDVEVKSKTFTDAPLYWTFVHVEPMFDDPIPKPTLPGGIDVRFMSLSDIKSKYTSGKLCSLSPCDSFSASLLTYVHS